jgi:hypothetical protein
MRKESRKKHIKAKRKNEKEALAIAKERSLARKTESSALK